MKKDRDCNNMYPIYPMPYMNSPMFGMPNQMPSYQGNSNDLINKINSLEKRVSNLEAILNNNYNTTGYQMM